MVVILIGNMQIIVNRVLYRINFIKKENSRHKDVIFCHMKNLMQQQMQNGSFLHMFVNFKKKKNNLQQENVNILVFINFNSKILKIAIFLYLEVSLRLEITQNSKIYIFFKLRSLIVMQIGMGGDSNIDICLKEYSLIYKSF